MVSAWEAVMVEARYTPALCDITKVGFLDPQV